MSSKEKKYDLKQLKKLSEQAIKAATITEEVKCLPSSHKLISEMRALSKIQKLEKDAEAFAKVLGNNGKDFPKPRPEQCEINQLADSFVFDIEEE